MACSDFCTIGGDTEWVCSAMMMKAREFVMHYDAEPSRSAHHSCRWIIAFELLSTVQFMQVNRIAEYMLTKILQLSIFCTINLLKVCNRAPCSCIGSLHLLFLKLVK